MSTRTTVFEIKSTYSQNTKKILKKAVMWCNKCPKRLLVTVFSFSTAPERDVGDR